MARRSRKFGKSSLGHEKVKQDRTNQLCSLRSSLNQLTAFQQARTPNHYLQSTTLTTTSGLGSNYTSYTTDQNDSSLSSLMSDNRKPKFNPAAAGTSSSFLESDLAPTDEYLYVPEGEHPRFMSPQKMNQIYESGYGGEFQLETSSCADLETFFSAQIFTFPTSTPT